MDSQLADQMNAVRHFDIESQDVPGALLQFGEQAELTVMVHHNANGDTPGLKGEFPTNEALRQLLAGTGLEYRIKGEAIIVTRLVAHLTREPQTTETNVPSVPGRAPLLRRIGATLAAVLAAPAALAESDESDTDEQAIEVIIVTAERRNERMLDTPLTMSAFSDRWLTELGVTNNQDLEQLVPGLQLGESGDLNHVNIRGMQTTNYAESHADLAVATYVDGVYTVDRFGIAPNLFDLERVEVSRGPQGTLNGRNSIAGALNYVYRRPTQEWEGEAQFEVTDQPTYRANFALGGPLSETVSFRLSGGLLNGDGAQENTGLGNDYDAPEQYDIAPQLRVEADRLDLNLRYQRVVNSGSPQVHVVLTERPRNNAEDWVNGAFFMYDEPIPSIENCNISPDGFIPVICDDPENKILANRDGELDNESDRFSLHADYEIADGLLLKYTFGKSETNVFRQYDQDLTSRVADAADPTVASDAPVPYSDAVGGWQYATEETSHEIQLLSNFDGATNFIAGLFAYESTTGGNVGDFWREYSLNSSDPFAPRYSASNPDPDVLARAAGFGDCADYVQQTHGPDFLGAISATSATCPTDLTLLSSSLYQSEGETVAVFFSVDHRLSERWQLAGGLRWTEDEKLLLTQRADIIGDFIGGGVPVAFTFETPLADPHSWDALIGHISASYSPSESVLVYGRLSTGYRAGGFQGIDARALGDYIEEEELVNYELGLKGLFLENRLLLTTGVFLNDYDGFQLNGFQRAPPGREALGPIPGWPFLEYTANIDGTRVWGFEAEATLLAAEAWRLSGHYTYLDSEIGDHEFIVFGDPEVASERVIVVVPGFGEFPVDVPEPTALGGKQLPQQPNHKAALVVEYEAPIGNAGSLHLYTSLSYTGERFPNVANVKRQTLDSYMRWDARASWRPQDARWEYDAFVQNLMDEIGLREFNPAIRVNPAMGRLTEPRRVGLSIRYRL